MNLADVLSEYFLAISIISSTSNTLIFIGLEKELERIDYISACFSKIASIFHFNSVVIIT